MDKDRYSKIIQELSNVLEGIDAVEIDRFAEAITGGAGIFCAGVGRSGYMMRAFSMRLMHCGIKSCFIGDTSTPGAAAGDVLVIGSGSGETESLKAYANKAKKLGLKILTITAVHGSTLGEMADVCIILNAPTPKSSQKSGFVSIQPMGSLFEQSLLLCLDGAVMNIMEKMGMSSEIMFTRHANLE